MMPESISKLLASGVATIITIHFLMFGYLTLLPRVISLFVQLRHEGDKRRAYEERVHEVKQGSFTPLVFSSSGGIGRSATVTYRCLASLLSDKWNSPYPVIMGWLCCSLSFSLLRSALMCVRGSQSRAGSPGVPVAVDLAVAEGHLATNDV